MKGIWTRPCSECLTKWRFKWRIARVFYQPANPCWLFYICLLLDTGCYIPAMNRHIYYIPLTMNWHWLQWSWIIFIPNRQPFVLSDEWGIWIIPDRLAHIVTFILNILRVLMNSLFFAWNFSIAESMIKRKPWSLFRLWATYLYLFGTYWISLSHFR